MAKNKLSAVCNHSEICFQQPDAITRFSEKWCETRFISNLLKSESHSNSGIGTADRAELSEQSNLLS